MLFDLTPLVFKDRADEILCFCSAITIAEITGGQVQGAGVGTQCSGGRQFRGCSSSEVSHYLVKLLRMGLDGRFSKHNITAKGINKKQPWCGNKWQKPPLSTLRAGDEPT